MDGSITPIKKYLFLYPLVIVNCIEHAGNNDVWIHSTKNHSNRKSSTKIQSLCKVHRGADRHFFNSGQSLFLWLVWLSILWHLAVVVCDHLLLLWIWQYLLCRHDGATDPPRWITINTTFLEEFLINKKNNMFNINNLRFIFQFI